MTIEEPHLASVKDDRSYYSPTVAAKPAKALYWMALGTFAIGTKDS